MRTSSQKEKKQKVEVRNKIGAMTYGAPELKSLYHKYAFRGLLLSIIFAAAITATVFTINSLKADVDEDNIIRDEFVIQNITLPEPPKVEEKEVTPPMMERSEVPQQQVALKDLQALVPEPVAKNESEALTTKTQDKLDEVTGPVSSNGTDDPSKVTWGSTDEINPGKIEEKEPPKEEPKKETFQQFEVEKAPVAVNLGSVKGSMKYPEIARSAGIEGKCVAKILVGTDGGVLKVGGISGPDVFHSEIENRISDLQFTPALQNGQPVKCWVSVPFSFTLGNK